MSAESEDLGETKTEKESIHDGVAKQGIYLYAKIDIVAMQGLYL